MQPPSGTNIPGNSTELVSQEIRVTNSQQGTKNVMLKLKISYKVNGNDVVEQATVSNFPPLY
jgi:AP-1 complex subunit gamma-1